MKSLLLMLMSAVTFANVAEAAPQSHECDHADWVQISSALNKPANTGESFRGELQGLMAEEMGPVCKSIPDLSVGIPGNRYLTYRISGSGDRNFELKIVLGGVEEPGLLLLNIKKL